MSGRALRTPPPSLHSFPLADQPVLQRSERALLVSADCARDAISRCHFHNDNIPWDAFVALDAQVKPMIHYQDIPADPLEQFLNPEVFQVPDTTTYEPMVQPNDPVNEYDGPVCDRHVDSVRMCILMPGPQLFDDWNSLAFPTSCESGPSTAEPHQCLHENIYSPSMSMYLLPPGAYPVEYYALDTLSRDISVTVRGPNFAPSSECPETVTPDSIEDPTPSPSSTRSSPFPETPVFNDFCPELPHIASPSLIAGGNVTRQEEQPINKATEVTHTIYPTSPDSVAPLSPLSECGSLPLSRCSSASPSSQSSEDDSASSSFNEEITQLPAKVAVKKVRRARAGAIRKKKTKSKEKHFCAYCNESFTRDHDAERHQRTCKSNPNCSQKEQCKVCTKPLPVRLDARRRHWGTLECSDAARKRGFTRMDDESYELL